MIFTLGRIFFPTLLHREKELRNRMRWIAIFFALALVAGVVGLIAYLQSTRLRPEGTTKPLRPHSSQPTH